MKNKTIFFVVGRLGKSLSYSKIIPFANTGYFKNIYIFRENPGMEIENAKYITIPKWLKRIKITKVRKIFIRIYEPIQLLKYGLKCKPDYINGIFTIPKGINACIISKIIKTKSIISVIGGKVEIDTYRKPMFVWKAINLFFLRKTNIITTKGDVVSNYLIYNNIHKLKIFTFNGFIDTKKYSMGINQKKDIDLLFVGTFRNLKGPDRVVKIISKLHNNFPNIKAIFLGNGYLFDKVKAEIDKLGLSNNIFLKGYRTDTYLFYQRAKVLVMPSRSEGLSMAMLEAMACGCVPIVSNVGNMTDAAFDGINSFVIDDYMDIDSFVDKIQFLLENPDKRDEMAKKVIELVQRKYSLEPQTKIAREIIDYGEQL